MLAGLIDIEQRCETIAHLPGPLIRAARSQGRYGWSTCVLGSSELTQGLGFDGPNQGVEPTWMVERWLYRGESAIRILPRQIMRCQKIARDSHGGCFLPQGLVSLELKRPGILLTSLFDSSELS